VIKIMTPEGKIINNSLPMLHSDPDGYMKQLDMSRPECIHTWREATPDEMRRRILPEISY
jgi:hypothetical protein